MKVSELVVGLGMTAVLLYVAWAAGRSERLAGLHAAAEAAVRKAAEATLHAEEKAALS